MHVCYPTQVKSLLMNIQGPMQTHQYPQEIDIKYDFTQSCNHLFHWSYKLYF